MRQPDQSETPRLGAARGAKGQSKTTTTDSATLGAKLNLANVIGFSRQPRCGACGAHLPWRSPSAVCQKHFAEDSMLRALSLRRQAMGDELRGAAR